MSRVVRATPRAGSIRASASLPARRELPTNCYRVDPSGRVDLVRAKQRELGDSPSDEALVDARLVPDPRKVRLRVYQTNLTHKS